MYAANALHLLSASEVIVLLTNNNITVEEYASALLARIKEHDDIVKAWTHLNPEAVLAQAKALDKIPDDKRGPLHGIPVGIKDVISTKDMPTEFGSPLYKNHQPGFDSSIVAILRAAGALIMGKTTTTQFSVTNSGPETTNPHDPNRTPGGSSCGSAAAVADYQVPLTLGAQTGGSLIRPASFTGVFAMKPTHNAVSTEGLKTVSPTFDTIGFMARSIEDLQLVANVLGICDDEAPKETPSLASISVALVRSPMWHRAGPGTVAAIDKAISILVETGVRVEEVFFPDEFGNEEAVRRKQKVIMEGEAKVTFLKEYRMDKTQLAAQICSLVENPSGLTQREQVQALDAFADMRAIADRIAASYSVILTPSAVDEAPLGLDDMGSAAFNTLWTGLHMPLVTVPAFVGANGMPIGVSLVAGRFGDQHLLSVATVLSEPLMAHGGWGEKTNATPLRTAMEDPLESSNPGTLPVLNKLKILNFKRIGAKLRLRTHEIKKKIICLAKGV
ncbi:amidase [Triangularia verruculosa]|uniref:Amidase n=1 Tax=Triangularia verruculosa TaxID=2587418 RepID=A0AAN6XK71_9PEZI|nr:amidase [Triangularia verruculosa]